MNPSQVFESESELGLEVMIARDTQIATYLATTPGDRSRLRKDLEIDGDISKMKSQFDTIAVSDVVAFRNKRGEDAGVYAECGGATAEKLGIRVNEESRRQAIARDLTQRYGFLDKSEVVGEPSASPLYWMGGILLLLVPLLAMSLTFDYSNPTTVRAGKARLFRNIINILGPGGLAAAIAVTVGFCWLWWGQNKNNPPTDEVYSKRVN